MLGEAQAAVERDHAEAGLGRGHGQRGRAHVAAAAATAEGPAVAGRDHVAPVARHHGLRRRPDLVHAGRLHVVEEQVLLGRHPATSLVPEEMAED